MAAALVVFPGVTAAQDDGIKGRWSVTFAGKAAVLAGGDVHEGGNGTVLGLPTSVDAKSYDDVYDTAFGWRAGAGYGVTRNLELFGDVSWERTEASDLSVGNVAGLDLRAEFGEYTSFGMEAGVRMHVAPGAAFNPYASVLGGFRRVSAIPGTFRVPAAGVTLPDTPFYDDSTVPVFGGNVGVLLGGTNRLNVGIEAGIRYHTDLSDIEGLAGTGLENLNDTGSRWSVPVSAVFRIQF
jgi:hypothetical protein